MPILFRTISLLLLIACTLTSCGGGNTEGDDQIYEGMDSATKMKMVQYMRAGKKLYIQHCANCHQPEGTGLGTLYPPLATADYLMRDPKAAACIVKNGQNGEIYVNGIQYNQAMPAHKELSNLEIAEIITYISNSWGNKSGLHSAGEIEKTLQKCQP
ncbi:MAG: cytochrome c [Bacteroidota bacterium]